MVRLTAELIHNSPAFLNCLKERELDLRGHKIPAIENLGAAEDQFDVLDLSDNEVTHLDGFTRMPRLTSLMLNNNRVSTIAAGLSSSIPNLETLIMTNNRIENLADLDQLAELTNLHTISLLKNEVAKKNHYRHYLIFKCPSLKIIDFRKVKYQETVEAKKLFSGKKGEELQKAIESERAYVPGEEKKDTMTEEQRAQIRAAIKSATTLQEVQRLEIMLQSGKVPKSFKTKESEKQADTNGEDDKMDTS